MSLAPYLSLGAVTSVNAVRSHLASVRGRCREKLALPAPTLLRTGTAIIALALGSASCSLAQEPAPNADAVAVSPDTSPNRQTVPAPPQDPNAIMGFENVGSWSVRTDGLFPDMNVQSSTDRTQGSAAFAVINPPSLITLTSRPVASTANALTGIGNRGALLQLDVQLPAGPNDLEHTRRPGCDPANEGWIDGFVSSRSRGLFLVPIGHVRFSEFRTGIYNTVGFKVPEFVSSALDDKRFSDLVFEFAVAAPGRVHGTYLFDNLRIHSVDLVQNPKGSAPPAGYGGSVDLTVPGNAPVSQSFALGPAQIPSGFHLKKGTTGATTVQLELGLDSAPSLTCTYDPDSTDASGRSYVLKSCTGGYEAGDLVSANWVSLGITGGDATQQIRAQLALSPLGDLAGSGLIPPMPTFWGDSDMCSPAPVPGTVVTTSTSCSSQTAVANQIVTNYFNQVQSAHPSPNWVVAPVPDSALRSGDGTPTNNLAPAARRKSVSRKDISVDPPFDTGGDLNPGGSFDAYWRLSGNLTPTAVTGTDENLTHFDAAFTAHGVLFGDDMDVVDAKVTADTDSGETTPAYKPATSSGTLGFYVFGEEIPSGGLSINPSTGFSVDPNWSQEYDLPPIQIWIFDITLGALVDADLNAQGSAALSGADLSVIPTASIGGHISGGINLGIASGDVDAKINLISLSTPLTAQVKWVLNTDPKICAATLNGALNGTVNVGSGGGEVDLDASFGPCPFCYTDSYTLVKWGPLVSKSYTLFNDSIDTQLFGLPSSLCTYPITVSIVSPTQNQSLNSGLPTVLVGSAAPNDNTLPFTATYNWTFTRGANASTATVNPAGANGPNPVVTFGAPTSGNTSTWTVGLTATTTVEGAGGTKTTQTASATPVTITVTNLKNGVYIGPVVNGQGMVAVLDSTGAYDMGNVPLPVTVTGTVSGATGTLNTTFTIAPCNDGTAACTSPGAAMPLAVTGAATTSPSAVWSSGFSGGYYKLTMNTTAGGSQFGSASEVVYGTVLF